MVQKSGRGSRGTALSQSHLSCQVPTLAMSCPGAAEIQATATVPELGLQGLATWGGRAEGRDHNGKTGGLSTFLGLNGETYGERADDMGHGPWVKISDSKTKRFWSSPTMWMRRNFVMN